MKFLLFLLALQGGIFGTINSMDIRSLYSKETITILTNALNKGRITPDEIDSLKQDLILPYLQIALPALIKDLVQKNKLYCNNEILKNIYHSIQNQHKKCTSLPR
jgi:hypothetical protein